LVLGRPEPGLPCLSDAAHEGAHCSTSSSSYRPSALPSSLRSSSRLSSSDALAKWSPPRCAVICARRKNTRGSQIKSGCCKICGSETARAEEHEGKCSTASDELPATNWRGHAPLDRVGRNRRTRCGHRPLGSTDRWQKTSLRHVGLQHPGGELRGAVGGSSLQIP
jgi:hypothetical protein